jgi:hypothetical protein
MGLSRWKGQGHVGPRNVLHSPRPAIRAGRPDIGAPRSAKVDTTRADCGPLFVTRHLPAGRDAPSFGLYAYIAELTTFG